MEESPDKKSKLFVTAYEKIATKSGESMAELRRKFAAPVRHVLYQDLVSTIWSVWHVRPDDITVGHIGDALDELSLIVGSNELNLFMSAG